MNINEMLREAFLDNEHRAPDSSQVLQSIRAQLDRKPRRYALMAPAFVAAVVIAVALTVALTRPTAHHSAPPAASGSPTSAPAPTLPTVSAEIPNSVASATAVARTILRSVPLPPGAREVKNVNAGLNGATLELSSLDANVSGVWRIPGTVSGAVNFALAHPAPGFTANCTCGSATVKWIDFYSQGQRRAINYVIEPSGSGAEIGITAIVPWVPDRPAWSLVPESATSVEVTVQRVRQAGRVGGAPTVHRTLTADAAHRLAIIANQLRPQAESICRGPVIPVAATDILIFHAPERTITFTMFAMNCPQFIVQATGQTTTYLEIGALDTALLHELGLPPNYGH